MSGSILDVAVVGGGYAGICASYYLKHFELEHMVFERGRIGESWRRGSWGSFTLPWLNRMIMLPGTPYTPKHPDAFSPVEDFISVLEQYTTRFQLPVSENTNVLRIEKPDQSPYYELTVYHENDGERKYFSWRVLMAAGSFGVRKIPPFAEMVPREVRQLHSSEYRRPALLPEGAILVVGSGQSGCEIAEELLEEGRAVYLATDKAARMPRRYRGKDIFDWLLEMQVLDAPTNGIDLSGPDPIVSGVGEFGHSISLQRLAAAGAVLLGRMEGIQGSIAHFDNSTQENVRFADEFEATLIRMIDAHIAAQRIVAPIEEEDDADPPLPALRLDTPVPTLDLMERNIGSVIWATGFAPDFKPLVNVPALDHLGNPVHHQGVSNNIEGLYFLGYPKLRNPKSNYPFGIRDDAAFVCNAIYTSIR